MYILLVLSLQKNSSNTHISEQQTNYKQFSQGLNSLREEKQKSKHKKRQCFVVNAGYSVSWEHRGGASDLDWGNQRRSLEETESNLRTEGGRWNRNQWSEGTRLLSPGIRLTVEHAFLTGALLSPRGRNCCLAGERNLGYCNVF